MITGTFSPAASDVFDAAVRELGVPQFAGMSGIEARASKISSRRPSQPVVGQLVERGYVFVADVPAELKIDSSLLLHRSGEGTSLSIVAYCYQLRDAVHKESRQHVLDLMEEMNRILRPEGMTRARIKVNRDLVMFTVQRSGAAERVRYYLLREEFEEMCVRLRVKRFRSRRRRTEKDGLLWDPLDFESFTSRTALCASQAATTVVREAVDELEIPQFSKMSGVEALINPISTKVAVADVENALRECRLSVVRRPGNSGRYEISPWRQRVPFILKDLTVWHEIRFQKDRSGLARRCDCLQLGTLDDVPRMLATVGGGFLPAPGARCTADFSEPLVTLQEYESEISGLREEDAPLLLTAAEFDESLAHVGL